MIAHPNDTTLNDFADGVLSEEAAAEVERHLTECAACLGEVEAIRALKLRAADLPSRTSAPDLWPGIEARIRASSRPPLNDLDRARLRQARRGAAPGPREQRRNPIPLLAAAAVALVALSSGITWMAVRDAGPASRVEVADSETPIPPGSDIAFASAMVDEVAAAYDPAITQLRRLLEEARDQLQPETVEAIELALEVIDQAIRDAAAALEADPGSGAALRALNATYETKVQLLRQAAGLTQGA